MEARISVLRDMRKLRFVPEGGTLVDVTNRTVQGRFLFRPSRELNDIVLGVLGRAQRLHPIRVCQVTVLSNHMHLLLDVDDAPTRCRVFRELGSGHSSPLRNEPLALHSYKM
jgi:hypothetical protein